MEVCLGILHRTPNADYTCDSRKPSERKNQNFRGVPDFLTSRSDRQESENKVTLGGPMIMPVQWLSWISSSFSSPHEMVPSPTPFWPASSSSKRRKLLGITEKQDVQECVLDRLKREWRRLPAAPELADIFGICSKSRNENSLWRENEMRAQCCCFFSQIPTISCSSNCRSIQRN